MIVKTLFRLLPLLLLCVSQSVLAEDQDRNRLVTDLMYKSGMVKQIEMIPQEMMAAVSQSQGGTGADNPKLEGFTRLFSSFFNPSAIKGEVRAYIDTHLETDDIRTVLEWLNSPLGRQITQGEEQASNPEFIVKSTALVSSLRQDETRVSKIKTLDSMIKGTEGAIKLARNIQKSIILAVLSEVPANKRPSVEAVMAEMNRDSQENQAMRTAIAEQMLVFYLLSYKDISDQALDRYIAFVGSSAGKRYHSVTITALSEALVNASMKMGKEILDMATEQYKNKAM